MLKKGGKMRPAPLPPPNISRNCILTEAAGVRFLDLGMLKKGLEAAQMCGHASLALCELNTSVHQDLCCLLGLVCRVCRKLTAFASSSYSHEQKNYTLNLDIFTAVAEESYGCLVKYLEQERDSSSNRRLDLKPSGEIRLIVEEPGDTDQDTRSAAVESGGSPNLRLSAELSPSEIPPRRQKPAEIPPQSQTSEMSLKSSRRKPPSPPSPTAVSEVDIKEEEEPSSEEAGAAEILTVHLDPLQSEYDDDDDDDDKEDESSEQHSALAGQVAELGAGAAAGEQLSSSLGETIGPDHLAMFSVLQQIQLAYSLPPNTPVMGGSVTPWPPARPIAASANLFIRTTCQKFGLPPGVYDYHRANGLRSVLVVKPEGGDYDSILKFFILTPPRRRRGGPAVDPDQEQQQQQFGNSGSSEEAMQRLQEAPPETSSRKREERKAGSRNRRSRPSSSGAEEEGSKRPKRSSRNRSSKPTPSNSRGSKNHSNINSSSSSSSSNSNSNNRSSSSHSKSNNNSNNSIRNNSSTNNSSSSYNSRVTGQPLDTKRTPLSIFSNLYSVWLKVKNPNISHQEIGYTVIDKWTKITDQEKEIYRQAVVDTELFNSLVESKDKFIPFYEALERR